VKVPDESEHVRLATAVAVLNARYSSRSAADRSIAPRACADVLAALSEFQECVRYLNTRRSKGAVLQLESEADVQDALYLVLRPWLRDLVIENPTDRTASRYAVKDFLIPSIRTVVEAKFIRDKSHGKSISAELHDDIEMYRRHPSCGHLVFFIYDPNAWIPDQRALVEAIEVERIYGGVRLHCHVLIKP